VTGDEVRGAGFWRVPLGYHRSDVDDFLRCLAADLDAGRPARPLIASAAFRSGVRSGYDFAAVDWFLDQFLCRADDPELTAESTDPWRDLAVVNQFTRHGAGDPDERPAEPGSRRGRRKQQAAQAGQDWEYLAQECADEWRDFGQQPGTYLRSAWVRAARFELRTTQVQAIASVGGHLWFMPRFAPKVVRAGGRSFRFRMTAPAGSSSQGIAEIAADSARDRDGHFAAKTTSSREQEADAKRRARERLVEVVDKAGTPILYISGRNFDGRAWARISFPDQRWLRFLVRGTGKANAIMTAVDQAGNKAARYRILSRGFIPGRNVVEVTVHPNRQLTDELVLAVAISAPWLGEYFDLPGGGG
jgi:hypothetical protein